jgi:hypothetical protein
MIRKIGGITGPITSTAWFLLLGLPLLSRLDGFCTWKTWEHPFPEVKRLGQTEARPSLVPTSELHLEAGRAIDAVTVGKVAEAGVQRHLAIERVFVIGPAIGSASTDAAPGTPDPGLKRA